MIEIPNRPNPLNWNSTQGNLAGWEHYANLGSGQRHSIGFRTYFSPSLDITAYDLYGRLHRGEPICLDDTDWKAYQIIRVMGQFTTGEKGLLQAVKESGLTYEISWPAGGGKMVKPRDLGYMVGLYVQTGLRSD